MNDTRPFAKFFSTTFYVATDLERAMSSVQINLRTDKEIQDLYESYTSSMARGEGPSAQSHSCDVSEPFNQDSWFGTLLQKIARVCYEIIHPPIDNREVEVVNLSNNRELSSSNITIINRKELFPKLSRVIIKNASLERVNENDLCRFLTHQIYLEMDEESASEFSKKIVSYFKQGTFTYTDDQIRTLTQFKEQIEKNATTIPADNSYQKIVTIKNGSFFHTQLSHQNQLTPEQQARQKLLTDWIWGGRGFKNHKMWKNGPQLVNDWPMIKFNGKDIKETLHVIYIAITELNLWDHIHDESSLSKVFEHSSIMPMIASDAAYRFAMGIMRQIAAIGWKQFCEK